MHYQSTKKMQVMDSSIPKFTPAAPASPKITNLTPTRVRGTIADNASSDSAMPAQGQPGVGTGFQGAASKLRAELHKLSAASPSVSSGHSAESREKHELEMSFHRHFRKFDDGFPKNGETISKDQLDSYIGPYVQELKEKANKSTHIGVPFHGLPGAFSGDSPRRMTVEERRPNSSVPRRTPRDVSPFILKLTNETLLEIFRGSNDAKKFVHYDFSRRRFAGEASPSGSGDGSVQTGEYFTLPSDKIFTAIAHVGTVLPTHDHPEIRKIPNLTLSMDLSGLKIEDAKVFMASLHNFVIRATVAKLQLDFNQVLPKHQNEVWTGLTRLFSAEAGTAFLRDLTLDIPNQGEGGDVVAAQELAKGLGHENCQLTSLKLIGGKWSEEAQNILTGAVEARNSLGRNLDIYLDDKKLEPSTN